MAGTDPSLPPPASFVVEGADPLMGLNLSGFVVTRLLASGGMGLVYLAEHETIGRLAAVKVLKPEVAADVDWTRRFLTEARALASLKHRNVIEVLNYGKTPDGRQYLMMEFLEGESLDDYIQRVGSLAPAVALAIAEQVLNGLAEAHKKGVVHRDLKPSNVFLLREHNGELLVKVIDFGLARHEPIALTEAAVALLPRTKDGASLLAGTPEYIAPEQAQGLKVDGSADLYSLGVMLFEMLSGSLPFESASVPALLQKHLSERPPRLSLVVANLPDGVEAFVEALLAKDPVARPASADAARVTVQRLLRRLSSEATAVRPAPEGKFLPTLRLGRARGQPGPTTDQSMDRAFPQRRRGLFVAAAAALVLLASWLLWPRGDRRAAPPPAAAAVEAAPVAPQPPPAAPPPAAVAEAPPAAQPEAEPDDLAPLAGLKTASAVLKATPADRPRPRRDRVVVEGPHCTPDDEWRARVKAELSQLGSYAARNGLSETFERHEKAANRYVTATSAGDCSQVAAALSAMRLEMKLPDE
jgi:serine/threonine-protein kinase